MAQTTQQIKKRYFQKVYDNADWIKCICGCDNWIKDRDHYGRPQKYVSGHNTRKYDDPTQYKREWNHRNRRKRYIAKMKRHRFLKVKLIKSKGSRCKKCKINYDGLNASIFHLHHRNREDKLFNVCNQLTVKAWATIVKEAEKCDLLCANCHEMKHGANF